MIIRIIAYGSPGPQGSKRFVGIGKKSGHAVMIESSKKVRPWREAVKLAAIEARDGALPMDGPLYVRMVFTLKRPRCHYRTGRNSHLLRDDAPKRPSTTPDLSKLARSTEDALTEARVWTDDARVSEYVRLAKVFENEDAEALDAPGVRIEISTTPWFVDGCYESVPNSTALACGDAVTLLRQS